MSKKSITRLAVFVTVCCIIFSLTGNTRAAEKVFKMRSAHNIQSFDPAVITNHPTSIILRAVYDNLLDYKPGAWPELEPELAEKYEVSPDGMTYTFHLKKGVQWQKGYGELTSEDVRFSVERIMEGKLKAPYRAMYTSVIGKIETPDKYTVRFLLKKPDPALLYKLAPWRLGSIVCKKAIEELGEKYGKNPETIVGSGPFEIAEWVPGQKVILKRYEKYHGRKAKMDRIETYPIRDPMTALLSLQKGELDFCYNRIPENAAIARKDPNLRVYIGKSAITMGVIALNTKHPILKDVRVRRAMIHALDRDLILETTRGEMGVKACGILAPGVYWGAVECDDLPKYPYDPEKARKLLAEAGYPNGFKLEYVEINNKVFRDLAPVVQAYWKEVGIDVNITLLPINEWIARIMKANAPAVRFSLGARPAEPSILLYSTFHSSSSKPGMNCMLYEGVDDLLEKVIGITNESERMAIYAQIQKKIMEDAVIIPIFFEALSVATRKNIDLGRGAKGATLTCPYWHYFWLEEIDLK